MKHKIKAIVAASLVAAFSNFAFAGTASTNIQVSATVAASCTIRATPLAFGVIDVKQDSTTNGQVRFTCSKGISVIFAYGAGSGTLAQRTMLGSTDNTEKLNYNIYLNSGPDILGDGTNGTRSISTTAQGVEEITFISGKVPAGQYVKPDNYTDGVTVTLSY